MPILNFSIRSQEVDNNDDVNTSTRITQKTFKLQNTYKMKYLKLLHIYHNISLDSISDGEGTQQNSIIFAKISFLNSHNTVFYEHNSGEVIEHGGMICLGETSKSQGESVFKELYKVLHDGKQLLFINQPFTIQLFKLVTIDPSATNTNVSVYNATGSHSLQPISIPEFRGSLHEGGHYISFTFEYAEDYSK